MRHRRPALLLAIACSTALVSAAEEARPLWTPATAAPRSFRLDRDALAARLSGAPREFTPGAGEAPVEVSLPLPDGRLVRFAVVESPVLDAELSARFPEIRTYAGTALDAPGTITRFDLSPRGLHAIVLGPGITAFVEPAVEGDGDGPYVSRKDQGGNASAPRCEGQHMQGALPFSAPVRQAAGGVTTRQGDRRIYHLVAAATGEFTAKNGGTVGSALAAITTAINGVNAIYRRDLGIHLELIAASANVIFTDVSTSPYTTGDFDCNAVIPNCLQPMDCLLTENQCAVDAYVGNANYDLAIVFDDVGRRGKAQGYSVCDNQVKARAATGLDVGVVAHEIGHMFGAWHTYNGTTGGCSAERDQAHAFEPGSGSTIMSYAGLCGDENLQDDFDLFFHHQSFLEIVAFSTGAGNVCAGQAETGNYAPVVQSWTAGPYTIPKKTPFSLSVQAYDPQDDPITYSWEQADTGGASPPAADDGTRPIFRAYAPTTDPERWFPLRDTVMFRDSIPPDTVGDEETCQDTIFCQSGETLPDTTRTMHYNVTLRDGQDGVTVAYATVASDGNSGPFEVTQPVGTDRWTQGAWREVKWNVANTNQPPVSCANVRILLSTDFGDTYPYVLAGSTPNDGSEMVQLPFDTFPLARIRIEAIGNVFFDISDSFTIEELKVRNLGDSGYGSLRQAILDANAYPTGATIPLQLPGSGVRTISVLTPLPALGSNVALEAWDIGGPDYVGPPLLELNGAGCAGPMGAPCDGLTLSGVNGYVNGVIVNRFTGSGIAIRGASAHDNLVQNCYVGTSADGIGGSGNAASGILIDGAHDNLLWGNVISGNQVGITIQGATATTNYLLRNRVGTDQPGNARIPNLDDGVRIVGAPNTIVGQPGDGNVISGNGTVSNGFVNRFAEAIDVSGASASGTSIRANILGLDAAGSAPLYNTVGGIRIVDAPNTLVGGTAAGARNVVGDEGTINYHAAHCVLVQGAGATGTVIQGNYLGTDATGTLDRGCRGAGVYLEAAPPVQIGGTTPQARNIISGNNDYGGIFSANGSNGAVIQGNYIGTDVTGMLPLGNTHNGITLRGGGGNVITGNVISASTSNGIEIAETSASGSVIQGNKIGTDAAGTGDLGNVLSGIFILRAQNTLIGGATPSARNVISGNGSAGIYVAGGTVGNACAGTSIQGNYVGTDVTGATALGNGTAVHLEYVTDTTISNNVLSASTAGPGVRHFSFGFPTTGVVIQENRIGTNAAGTAAMGNNGEGILGSISGTAQILGNVIGGNALNGISMGQGSFTVQGNWIGTDTTATLDLRNTWSGIYSTSPAPCLIGGSGPGHGNVIAFNSPSNTGINHAGVQVQGAATGLTIRGNRMFSNTGLGIDLHFGGPAFPNDHCDPDSGQNGVQNFPSLSGTHQSGSSTRVTGTLDSTAGTTFTVDFYASPSCDPLGFGEGATWLGSTNVTTNGSCVGSFDLLIPAYASGVVTATATDPSGSTSEFSACAAIAASPVSETGGLQWTSKQELTWAATAEATSYRVLRGVPAALPDLRDADLDSCTRFSGPAPTTGPTLTENPATAGVSFYWYLVVGSDGANDGPAGFSTTGPRIANEAGACP